MEKVILSFLLLALSLVFAFNERRKRKETERRIRERFDRMFKE